MRKIAAHFQRQTVRIGAVAIEIGLDENGALATVELPAEVPPELDAATLREIIAKLSRYKISPHRATGFTQRVWEKMRAIPPGQTLSYGAIAESLGLPRGARAVGGAVGANPLLVLFPCHRVVGKNNLGGFRHGLAWKRRLLELERSGTGVGA